MDTEATDRHVYSFPYCWEEHGGKTKMLTDKSDDSHWFSHVPQADVKKKEH